MELKKRKQLRLKDYDYSSNGGYFITICTHERRKLLCDAVGANLCVRPNAQGYMIEKWLLQLACKYPNVTIDKYVIMPNHIHMILMIATPTGEHIGSPLHQMIKWVKTQTTNDYIRGVKRGIYPPFHKHLWQRNYYEHIIRTHESYQEIWQYIHTNPLQWESDEFYSN